MANQSRRGAYDAVIIGAGHNGLVCAYYLARAGLKVRLLERRSVVGGAAVTEEFYPGFRNSTASYTVSLLSPMVIKDMGLAARGLKIILRPLSNMLPTEDGRYLLLGGSVEETQKEFQKFSPKDAAALPAYYQKLEQVADLLRKVSGETPPNPKHQLSGAAAAIRQLWPTARGGFDLQQEAFDLFTKSARGFLDRWFESDIVKAAFGFDAVVGNYASPDTPGSAYVLLHHVFGEVNGVKGAWGHAIGGMGAITDAMRAACEEASVEISVDSGVASVMAGPHGAEGVILDDGETVSASRVISNVNPKLLYTKLIDGEVLNPVFRQRMDGWRCGSGTFRMNVALSALPDFSCMSGATFSSGSQSNGLADDCAAPWHKSGIVIAPSLDYMDAAYIDAKQYGWSRKPIIEMLIPSTVDDSLAPPGAHVASLFCQQFAPTLPDGRSWHDEKNTAADDIIETVNQYAPNFKASVIGRRVLSPLDLEEQFGLIGGDIFHGAMTLDQLWSARPALGVGDYRGAIANLYHCGAGAHPGGGVTGLPGRNAAREILRDWGKRLPR